MKVGNLPLTNENRKPYKALIHVRNSRCSLCVVRIGLLSVEVSNLIEDGTLEPACNSREYHRAVVVK